MQLTSSDEEKVKRWLAEKCGQMRCFCCGNGQWTIVNIAGIRIGFDTHSTRFHYHEGVPTVAVSCNHCAHIVTFAAVALGLKPDPAPPEPVPAPAKA